MDSNCCLEPASYAATEEDYTDGLIIKVFDNLDKVGADVVLLHSCLRSCMPKVLLVREMFLTKDS